MIKSSEETYISKPYAFRLNFQMPGGVFKKLILTLYFHSIKVKWISNQSADHALHLKTKQARNISTLIEIRWCTDRNSQTNIKNHPPTHIHKHPGNLPPSCLSAVAGSQGQGWQHGSYGSPSSSQSLQSSTAWSRSSFPGGSDPCLKGFSVVQSEDCWSLAVVPARATNLLSSDRRQSRKEVWPGNSSSASKHVGWAREGEEPR